MNEPLCYECPLGNRRNKQIVPFQTPSIEPNGLVIIGEQPARVEVAQGVPFVGPSGELLDKILGISGIRRDACYVTNAFHCFAPDLDDKQKLAAAKACRPRLIGELQSWPQTVIYALGRVALKSLMDDWGASIEAYRGSMLRSSIADLCAEDIPDKVNVTCSYHPAAILQSPGQIADIFHDDTRKVSRWLTKGPTPWTDSFIIAPKPEELYMTLGYLKQEVGGAAVDVECIQGEGQERYNRWFDRLRMVGLGWSDFGVVVPWLDGEWQAFYSEVEFEEVKAILRDFFEDKSAFSLFHNFQYDVPVLARHGLKVENIIHDTMEAHYSLYHMGVKHNLGYVAQQYLDVPPWKEVHGKEHEATDFTTEAIYNSRDVRNTGTLWGILSNEVVYEDIWATYAMCMSNNIVALDMSEYGFWVDPIEYEATLNHWAKEKIKDQQSLLEVANVGPTQMLALDKLNSVKNRESIMSSKLDSFAEGQLSPSDPAQLLNAIYDVEGKILWKKLSREIKESAALVEKRLGVVGQDSNDLYIVRQVGKAVKLAKKEKTAISDDLLDALPKKAVDCIRSIVEKNLESVSEKRRELLADLESIETLTEKQADRLDKLRFELSPEVTSAEDLRKLKTSDWVKVEKLFKPTVSKLAQATKTAARRLDRAVNRIPFVNFGSDYEAGKVIHEWFGLPVEAALTSKGDYAVNEDALNHVKGHPLIQAYQKHVTSQDRWRWIRDLPIYPDGRMHPVYKPRLKSGRWASGDSGPTAHPLETLNGQNIEEIMMSIFRAGPGKKFVGADYSGLELRVGGAQTGCRTLMDQFARYDAGQDLKVHAQTARLIWKDWAHLPLEEQKKHYQSGEKYKMAKSGGFLTFYAGGWEALAAKIKGMEPYIEDPQERANREAEIDEEARAFMQYLQNVWPEVFAVREEWYHTACREGRLKIGWLTNRFLRFPLTDRDHVSPTLCANAPVQSTAGEIAHTGLIKLHRHLPSCCKIILYIHDCIIVECPEDMAEDIRVLMKECMEYWFEGPIGGILCRADPKIGDSIAEVH